MQEEDRRQVAELIRRQRWAALATQGVDGPVASMVAFCVEPDFGGLLLHLSRLAVHTRNLLVRPAASLVIGEPDSGDGDPQQLARLTVTGDVEPIAREQSDYPASRHAYLERIPTAGPLFDFGDFELFRLRPREARFVGGFGRALTLSGKSLKGLADRSA